MEHEKNFRLGFWFALLLAKTLDFNPSNGAIYGQLRSIAHGEFTLMPSPEDALRDSEAELGRPLTESERTLFNSCLPTNRTEQDARNQELAKYILQEMGQPV